MAENIDGEKEDNRENDSTMLCRGGRGLVWAIFL